MIISFKKAPLFVFLFLITISLFFAIGIFAFTENEYGISVICIVTNIFIVFAAWCRFFAYGLRINDKRIIAIEQSRIKIIPLEAVSRITVKFTNKAISALIKTKDQNEIQFVWDSIFLSTHTLLSQYNEANITSEFVEKSIAELSKCDKVHIQNYFN